MKKQKLIFINLLILIILIVLSLFYIGSKIEQIKLSDNNQIFINEVMASNSSTLKDGYGNYSDWIELYNAGSTDVNLANYYLSDRLDNLTKWKISKKVILKANGYLLIWASGKNKADANNEFHTNFSLNADGETIVLVAPDGKTIINSLDVIRTNDNISYGRTPDGTNSFGTFYLNGATPRKSNLEKQNKIQSPLFSNTGGFYQSEFQLSLLTDDNSTIYYTTDGSIPTENSIKYDQEIIIKSRTGDPNILSNIKTSIEYWQGPPKEEVYKGTVVRAVAIKDGQSSDVVTHTYFIDENIDRYKIPVISISTNMENLFDSETGLFIDNNALGKGVDWERVGHIEFFDESNQIGFSEDIGIRIHGGYTRDVSAKTLRIYARNSQGYFKYPLFKDKEIDIYNSFLLRNGGSSWKDVPFRDAFAQSLIQDLTNVDTQHYQPSIVFINGEYWGIYNIRDRYDADYIYNHYGTSDIDMVSDLGNIVDYGSNEDYYKLLHLLSADLNYGKNYDYVKELLDINNFTDYHIAQIFYMNVDQPGKNVKIWKTKEAIDSGDEQTDGKWRYLLYDTDMGFSYGSFSNYDRNGLIYNTGLDYHGATDINPASNWPEFAPNNKIATFPLRAILKNDEFRIDFINRFADLLNTSFHEDVTIMKLEAMKQQVDPYMDEHIKRWQLPSSMKSWENNIETIKLFALNRPHYMREHIVDYFGLTGTSTITTVSDRSKGYITVNSIDITEKTPNVNDSSHWTGIYFDDMPISITANPVDGYRFTRWESSDSSINGTNDASITIILKDDVTIEAIYEAN